LISLKVLDKEVIMISDNFQVIIITYNNQKIVSVRGEQKSSTCPKPFNPIEKLCLQVRLNEYGLVR